MYSKTQYVSASRLSCLRPRAADLRSCKHMPCGVVDRIKQQHDLRIKQSRRLAYLREASQGELPKQAAAEPVHHDNANAMSSSSMAQRDCNIEGFQAEVSEHRGSLIAKRSELQTDANELKANTESCQDMACDHQEGNRFRLS